MLGYTWPSLVLRPLLQTVLFSILTLFPEIFNIYSFHLMTKLRKSGAALTCLDYLHMFFLNLCIYLFQDTLFKYLLLLLICYQIHNHYFSLIFLLLVLVVRYWRVRSERQDFGLNTNINLLPLVFYTPISTREHCKHDI
jgi:hypothetical protein